MSGRSRASIASRSAAAIAALASARVACAQVDSVVPVLGAANAVASGTSLATFGYDPVNDRAYVASNFNANQSIRLIGNVSGAQTVQTQISEAAWLYFEKGSASVGTQTAGTYGGGSPIPGGFLLNPQPIPALGIGAYSSLWVTDASTVVTTPTQAPNLTQRVYRYNLGQEPAGGDASNEMTSVMTLSQYQTAAGLSTTTTNVSRQFAWSGDGQSIYFIDSSTSNGFGGIWKVPAAGGTPVHLLSIGTIDTNSEPAVTTAGGVDTIYFRGGTLTSNAGGIDKITYDGTTATARSVAIPAATLNSFLELSTGSMNIASMCSDAAGNLYFNDTSGNRPGIYCYDAQGRLFKVASKAERQAALAVGTQTANSNTLRMQPRTITYNNGTASFPITQILYAESTPINMVAGANVFTPGDFNRDGVIDQSDIGLFKGKLTVKAGPPLAVADARYDLNGNGICSYQDVKVLQQFYPFYEGDTDLNKTVDLTDFTFLAANFNGTGKTWLQGDFSGDETVDLTDFTYLAANFNKTAPGATAAVGAAVPEPTSLAAAGLVASAACVRRTRGRRRPQR